MRQLPGASDPACRRRVAALGLHASTARDQLGTYSRAMEAHGDIASFRVGPPSVGFEFDAVFDLALRPRAPLPCRLEPIASAA